MLVLVSGATKFPRNESVGHLIVPRQWDFRAVRPQLQPGRWGMDNGGFLGFEAGAYIRMLEKFADVPGCLFVTAPDFVGDFASTLDRWPFWCRLIRGIGHVPAFVAQDGLQPERMPWDAMGALFIGGTDAFKESPNAASLMAFAKARGIWVHVGRVNGRRRYGMMLKSGADSIDGTGFSMAPDTNIPKAAEWHDTATSQPGLL